MEFGEQPVLLVGEEEGDLERKQLAFRGASHKCSGSSSCIQRRELRVFRKGLCLQPGGRWVRTSSVFVLFHAALQSLKRQNLKTEIEEGKQGEKDLPGWAEGALLAVSGPHWSIQGMAGCEASPTVFTERRPASWQTRARPSGEVPGCSAAGTLLSTAKGAWIQSLVRELRFRKPHSAAKEKKKRARPSVLPGSLFRGGETEDCRDGLHGLPPLREGPGQSQMSPSPNPLGVRLQIPCFQ